jgi:hypothetical protein
LRRLEGEAAKVVFLNISELAVGDLVSVVQEDALADKRLVPVEG